MTSRHWKRHAAVAALLALGGATTPALAQPKGGKPPPPPAAAAGDSAKATALFVKGSDFYKAKKFREALDAFKGSYAAVASPNSHLYIARCMAQLGETRAAYLELGKVIEEASARAVTEEKYAPTRDQARVEREELNGKLAFVTVYVPGADSRARVLVGKYDLPPDQWNKPFPVEPGPIDVIVDTAGRPPIKQSLMLSGGDKKDVTLEAGAKVAVVADPVTKPKGSGMSGLRIGGIVALGVGVVGIGMFAGAGAASSGTYSDLKAKCGGDAGGCGGRNVNADISSGQTQQGIANAGLVIGILGVATGTTLIVLSTRKKSAPATGLVVGPSYAGVHGEF